MIKIVVISDTHIPERSTEIPKKLLDDLKTADMIIHAGDLVDISVLETLKKICPNVKAVQGNMDHEEVKTILPEKEVFKIGKYRIGLAHGWGAPSKLIEVLTTAFENIPVDIIIFGHSHCSVNEKINGILYFNPGSPTDKIFAASNSYGIIEINDKIEAKIIKL
ncbi:MAG: metallophosphoesterase [Candidatus Omnitrophica bacterium]|nr:metallophosphoesterase [Candidatus Omnitrophota bacterium]